jgi:hypothetical protein
MVNPESLKIGYNHGMQSGLFDALSHGHPSTIHLHMDRPAVVHGGANHAQKLIPIQASA